MATETKQASFAQFLVTALFSALLIPAIVLPLSGDWLWLEGWIFALWFDAMLLGNLIYLYYKDPALLAERSKRPGSDNQKGWDKYVLSAAYGMAFLWFIIMPLDAKRFNWSPDFPIWLEVIGALMLIPALYFIQFATMANTYMSTLVRIQEDRKQEVISTGVYGIVRHPLYLGCLLMMVGAPLMLGSITGLLITFIGLVVLAGRIIGEEKMLSEELAGYNDYQQKVHYRLIPFVW